MEESITERCRRLLAVVEELEGKGVTIIAASVDSWNTPNVHINSGGDKSIFAGMAAKVKNHSVGQKKYTVVMGEGVEVFWLVSFAVLPMEQEVTL